MAKTAAPRTDRTPELSPSTQGQSDGVESWLEGYGVKYTLYSVPMALIDQEASLANQARLSSAINENTVETYTAAMERGDKFPAGVAYERNGKLVIIDGNHRFLAAQAAGHDTTPMYILAAGTRPELIVKLTFEANTRHGLPNSIEDRVAHGIYLVENSDMSQRDAAEAVNIPYTKLQAAWSKQQADRRARVLGVNDRAWNSMPISSRTKLNVLKSDEVFKKVLEIVTKTGMRHEEMKDMVTEINKETGSTAQLAKAEYYYEANRDRIQAHAGKVSGRGSVTKISGDRQRLLMGVGQILSIDTDQAMIQIHDAERESVLRRLVAAGEKLGEVISLINEQSEVQG